MENISFFTNLDWFLLNVFKSRHLARFSIKYVLRITVLSIEYDKKY